MPEIDEFCLNQSSLWLNNEMNAWWLLRWAYSLPFFCKKNPRNSTKALTGLVTKMRRAGVLAG